VSERPSSERAGSNLGVHLALAFVPILWGLNFPTTKILLEHWDPFGFLAARFLTIAPIAILWALLGGGLRRVARADWPLLLIAGFFGIAIYQLCFVFSLAHTTIFASALFSCTFPLFTMMAGALMGQEHPRPWRWGGALIAFLGLAVFEGLFAGRAEFRLGDLLALTAAVAFTPYTLVIRRLSKRYTGVELLAVTLAIGTIVLAIAGWNGMVHQDYRQLDTRDWLLFGYVVVFPILVCYAVFNWGIARIGAGPASMYAMSVPIAGGLSGALIFKTGIPIYEILGAAVCIAGLVIVQVSGDARRNAKRTTTLSSRA
jgi:drug/metabolite transporter (DMT)-like permease